MSNTATVFDIGMYDCADTAYYLEIGNRVVAVEANREFVQRARERFSAQIASGQLTIVNAAISTDTRPVELVLSGDDLGASSVFGERIADRQPIGSITAPGLPVRELLGRYGIPHYLKVDIEGADRLLRPEPDRRDATSLSLVRDRPRRGRTARSRARDRLHPFQDHQSGLVSRACQSKQRARSNRPPNGGAPGTRGTTPDQARGPVLRVGQELGTRALAERRAMVHGRGNGSAVASRPVGSRRVRLVRRSRNLRLVLATSTCPPTREMTPG